MAAAATLTKTGPRVEVRQVRIPNTKQVQMQHHVTGMPWRSPDFSIVTFAPIVGVPRGEMYEETVGKQTYLRSWTSEFRFVGSPNFPEGIEVGLIQHWIDTGTGQPYVEQTECQLSEDAMVELRCAAQGEPFLTMAERRRIAQQTEQWVKERQATGHARPGTASPSEVFTDVAADRLDAKIQARVDALVEKALADRSKKDGG